MGKKNILVKFFVSYLLVLAVPLIMSGMVYKKAVQIAEDDARTANMSMLEQTKETIDGRMKELDTLALQISWNSKVKNFMFSPGPLTDGHVYRIFDMLKDLYTYRTANNFILNYYIHFNLSDVIITPDGKNTTEEFYVLNRYEDWDYDEWYKYITTPSDKKEYLPRRAMLMNGHKRNVITYTQSLPIDDVRSPMGALVFIIDEQQIKKLLQHSSATYGSTVYILDDKGDIISVSDGGIDGLSPSDLVLPTQQGMVEQTINGDDMIITYTTSPTLGWRYVSVTPRTAIMAAVNDIKKLILITVILCIATGLAMAYAFAYKNSSPIRRLVSGIKQKLAGNPMPQNDNEYDFIENAISQMVDESRTLKDTMQKQMPFMKDNFYARLLKGEFRDLEDMESYRAFIGLQLDKPYFGVLVIQSLNRDKSKMLRMIVADAVTRLAYDNCYVLDVGDGNTALFLAFDSDAIDPDKMIREMAERIREELYSVYSVETSIAVGHICQGIDDIHKAYRKAVTVLKYSFLSGGNTVLFCDDEDERISYAYYYPPEIEIRLMNMVRAGDVEGVNNIWSDINEENFTKRQLSPVMVEYLLTDMKSTLIKILGELKEAGLDVGQRDDLSEEFNELSETGKAWERMWQAYEEICACINARKKSHNDELKDNILEFIETNYSDPSICLAGVAHHFNISESYLSRFVAEHIGENFSVYLNRFRVAKAEELLRCSDLTIAKIAEVTGFSSDHVFINIFKRINGLTPGNYRKAYQKDAIAVSDENTQ